MRFWPLLLLLASFAWCACATPSSKKRTVLQELDDDPTCDPLMPRSNSCFTAKNPMKPAQRTR